MFVELELLDLDKMFSPRNDDEMKELTERLHSYIKKMRELRTGAPALDTNNFFKVSENSYLPSPQFIMACSTACNKL